MFNVRVPLRLASAYRHVKGAIRASRLNASFGALNWPIIEGVLDSIKIEPIGLIRITGWSRRISDEVSFLKLFADGVEIPLLNRFFISRTDLPRHDRFTGFTLEYYVASNRQSLSLQLTYRGRSIWHRDRRTGFVKPDYEHLVYDSTVLNRDQIYGYGPPASDVHPVIVALATKLSGTLLDFGCGSGALIRQLCTRGIDTHGIEIDRPAIRQSIEADVRDRITLYDGAFPLPYSDKSFESVVAIEVIEHVHDFDAAIAEIARICRGTFLLTVPDISAVPIGFAHGVVPWHLMESTHLNFFNQASLSTALSRHFRHLEFGRINPVVINGSTFYMNIATYCRH